MSHPLLSFPIKKPPYSSSNFRSSDVKNSFKNLSHHLHIKLGYRLDRLSQILYKRVQKIYFSSFRRLKMVLNVPNSHVFDKRIDRSFEKLLDIIKINKLKMLYLAFYELKSHSDTKALIEKMSFIQLRILIKVLSTSANLVKYKKIMFDSSKSEKYQGLKARYFMAICENIISQKSISKELYKSFREWHLQSILKKLSSLNEEQKDMVQQQKQISSKLLKYDLLKVLNGAFSKLKLNCGNGDQIDINLTYNLMINYLIEKISVPFLKHSILLFPRLKWNSSQYDALFLLKMSSFFKRLQGFTKNKGKTSTDKIKTFLHLTKLFKSKEFMYKESAFRQLLLNPQKENSVWETRAKPREILILYRILKKLVDKQCIYFFEAFQIQSIGNKNEKLSLHNVSLKNGLTILRNILEKNSHQDQRNFLYKWKYLSKTFHETKRPDSNQKIIEKKFQLNFFKFRKTLSNMIKKNLRHSFHEIAQYSHEKQLTSFLLSNQVASNQNSGLSAKKANLINIIKNQSIINAKLEKSHKRKATESLKSIQRYKQINALETLLYKDYQRKQENKKILHGVFTKWQTNISFEDAKIKEYNNFIKILEGERETVVNDIQQLEQLRLEKAEVYLNFLEEVNSDLIERIEVYDRELKNEIERELERLEGQEPLNDNELQVRRTLSN